MSIRLRCGPAFGLVRLGPCWDIWFWAVSDVEKVPEGFEPNWPQVVFSILGLSVWTIIGTSEYKCVGNYHKL